MEYRYYKRTAKGIFDNTNIYSITSHADHFELIDGNIITGIPIQQNMFITLHAQQNSGEYADEIYTVLQIHWDYNYNYTNILVVKAP